MSEPRWVSEKVVKAIHAQLIAEHGGETGVLNAGQLSSTLARPQNLYSYGVDVTLFKLAASYGYGLVKNHCFVDGNKRVSVAVIGVFLRLNGYAWSVDEASVVIYMLKLADSLRTSEEDESELADWLKKNSKSI